MSRTVTKRDIPTTDERHEMTLDNVGWWEKHKTKLITKWIIDNGRYKGKFVSHVLDDEDHATLDKLCEMQGLEGDFTKQKKRLRISAIVIVTRQYQIDGEWHVFESGYEPDEFDKLVATYALTGIQMPEGESDLAERKLFNRRNAFRRR